METTPDAPAISAVDNRIPPFSTTDPQLWFLQVESQFTARRITAELTKYHHVVASLPPAIASEIRDLLVAPPAENAYTTLKQLLISRLTPSEPQRLQQLLPHTELGDRTPSQLLRHMRQQTASRALPTATPGQRAHGPCLGRRQTRLNSPSSRTLCWRSLRRPSRRCSQTSPAAYDRTA
ncbi:hypothetical protein HPB50_023923 [Hyalomma asiaticum]|uniref:Uncharacterized protein n=1 Tax=Hyalomma asiaticum TaxID=266040 RepID=A0ACB7S9D2_HYAAI|nr:hypothetical protein HPB50_023923 [Hyalomma asiaticum]